MRWREPLDEVLGSRAKVRAIRVLWCADGAPLSGREVARRCRLSHTGVLRALAELEAQNVVWPATDATGTRYKLNREHVLVEEAVVPMMLLEASLGDRVTRFILDAVPRAVSITLFGSVARGEDRPESDMDVLVVVPDDMDPDDTADLIDGMACFARFGKVLNPVIFTRRMLGDAWKRRLPLLDAILEEGRPMAGAPVGSLVMGRRRAAG